MAGKMALLIIDMQYDFLAKNAPVHCVGGLEMVPSVKELASACRNKNIPVIYTQEVHRPSGVDMGRELDGNEPDHCIIGSRGVEIHDDIKPLPEDYLIRKVRYDAFLGTDLSFLLNGLGILPGDTLMLCGVASNVCVHYTGAGAHQHDYRIKVVEDCCAGSSIEEHEAAMRQLDYLQNGARIKFKDALKIIGQF